ncbi:hypothetical protein L1987_87560 [Smallanthus sonchifolius]|nr:hypothetical protein L1987_87560 [Smallanthus sonchifolius]
MSEDGSRNGIRRNEPKGTGLVGSAMVDPTETSNGTVEHGENGANIAFVPIHDVDATILMGKGRDDTSDKAGA